jgi:hypothetical protein
MDGAASEAGQSQRHEAQKPQHRPVGGPVPRPWREGTLTRARELQALWTWVVCKDPPEHYEDLAEGILEHLEAAREAAEGKRLHPKRWFRRFWLFRKGSRLERAMSNSTQQRLCFSTSRRQAMYLVRCPACSMTCNGISFRRLLADRNWSVSGNDLG